MEELGDMYIGMGRRNGIFSKPEVKFALQDHLELAMAPEATNMSFRSILQMVRKSYLNSYAHLSLPLSPKVYTVGRQRVKQVL